MSLNRAGFLRQLAASALDVLPMLAPGLAVLASESSPAREQAGPWRTIGSLGDFAPGSATPVLAGEYVLIAHARGLYALGRESHARGEQAPRLALRLEADGKLSLHPQAHWPADCCLSILTGNRILEENLL